MKNAIIEKYKRRKVWFITGTSLGENYISDNMTYNQAMKKKKQVEAMSAGSHWGDTDFARINLDINSID